MAGRMLCEDPLNATAESRAIDRLGSDPAQWIVVLDDLENVQNEYRKGKLLGCFFSRARRHLNPRDLAKNESYAILLGREAMFHCNISIDHARLKFESAILSCQLPVIHLMYAQFELNGGDQSKALEILCRAKLDFGDTPQIQSAIKKVMDGRAEIFLGNFGCGQNVVSRAKHQSISKSVNTADQYKEQNTRDLSQSSLHNLSTHNLTISTPKLNKDGTARLLGRQKELASVIDKGNNLHTADTQSPVTRSSQFNIDIGLQSPAAPDLSILSREFQPSNTLRLLEAAKESHQKRHDPPVLKSLDNKKIECSRDRVCDVQSGSISAKPTMPNLSSHKKFVQGPQRVLRVSKDDSDDDSPKKPTKIPNVDKENINSLHGNELGSSGTKVKTQDVGSVSASGVDIPQVKTSLNINQTSGSAFKPPSMKIQAKHVLDARLSDDKENKVPHFSNIKSSTFLERNRPDIPAYHVDTLSNRKVSLSSLTLREPDSIGKSRVPPTAAELVKDKKVLCVNGVWYLVLKILGKGGSSKVYQAFDPKTSQIVAIKQVNLTDVDEQVLDGYKNEIKFLTSLQGSRYIVKLIDYELKERCLYVVMECGSSDLSVFLKNQKVSGASLHILDIKMLWKNMLRAVEAIHAHGVIHLDLKPANFMFMDCNLKLIDFGIANSIQADATSVIKDTQFGTLNYMAPEMINDMSGGGQSELSYQPKFKVGPKADVWSLGCILYYIMYGKTPFQHIHHQAMKLFAITNENHKIEFPSFPVRELVDVVHACLVRDPKKRPSVEILLSHPMLS